MFVETALVASLALASGYAWGLKRKPSASPPDFSRLQAQMMHARNMGMRMNELASSEVKLERERQELERLMALKEEVQWLLETVETMIQHPDPTGMTCWSNCWTPRANRFVSCSTLDKPPSSHGPPFVTDFNTFTKRCVLPEKSTQHHQSTMNRKTMKTNMIQ